MKFIIDNIWLIGLILISGGALLIPTVQRRGKKLSLFQATQLMNQSKCLILDVREAAEFDAGHIKNAKNIPLAALTAGRITDIEKHKTSPILTVCASGTRSATATFVLNRAGFMNVVSLEGGMASWQEQGLPTVKGNG